jgi:hypothetical protein
MANTYLKVGVIAQTMIELLFRELVVAKTVWTDAVRSEEFVRALDDTVTLRVPARRAARTRALRGTGGARTLTMDESTEFAVPVKLTSDIYNGAPITDEEFDLDIYDFGAQVLVPQIRAVAEGIEDAIVSEITGATYPGGFLDIDNSDPYLTFVEARKLLNDANVPQANRTMLVGSSVESALLASDRFRADVSGPTIAENALQEATIGRMAGFTILQSNALEPEDAYAYVRSAFVLASRTPKVPQGAKFGQDVALSRAEGAQVGASMGGLSARWIMDYDSVNATDRSFTSTWVGTATVKDPDDFDDPASTKSLVRAVKLSLSGS